MWKKSFISKILVSKRKDYLFQVLTLKINSYCINLRIVDDFRYYIYKYQIRSLKSTKSSNFNFSLLNILTSSFLLNSIRYYYKYFNSSSFGSYVHSNIGIPFSNYNPKECGKLSIITISFKSLFVIILKSFIKKPFLVSKQLFLHKISVIYYLFGSRWFTIALAYSSDEAVNKYIV